MIEDTYQSTDLLACCRGLSLREAIQSFGFSRTLLCFSSSTRNMMMWDDSQTQQQQQQQQQQKQKQQQQQGSHFNFDILSLLNEPQGGYIS
jgi:hypothetical protein